MTWMPGLATTPHSEVECSSGNPLAGSKASILGFSVARLTVLLKKVTVM